MSDEARPSRTSRAAERPRIGLLFDSLWDDFEAMVWRGVVDEAQARDASLVCFAGGAINAPMPQHRVRTIVHEMIGRHNVDALLVATGCVGAFISPEEARLYLARFTDLPLMSLSVGFDDIPSIVVDNHSGMYELVSHFIDVHQRKHIAFINGPEENFDATERFAAYKKALADHGIAYDPKLVVPGNFIHGVGERAILTLVREREVSFDAVVAANDNMAVGAMQMLRRLGFGVPGQIAVGGFDDSRGARSITPTLTTVRQPTYEIGRLAVRGLLGWLETGTPPANVEMPTRLVIRGSCGCLHAHHGLHVEAPDAASAVPTSGAADKPDYAAAVAAKLGQRFVTLTDILDDDSWAARLVEACIAEHQGTDGALRTTLERMFAECEAKPVEAGIWTEILHALFGLIEEQLSIRREVRDTALLLAGQYVETRRSRLWIEYEYQTEMMQRFLQPVRSSFELREIGELMKEALPPIGVYSCALSLYESTPSHARELSQLVLQLSTYGTDDPVVKTYTAAHAPRFATGDLVPDGFRSRERGYRVVVYPLSFESEHFGFVAYDIGNTSATVYEIISSHLIALIKGVRLLEETRNYTEKLERDVTVRTAELRLANEMLQKANSLMHNKSLEIEKLNAELLQKSKLDSLTNLYNRRAALDLLRAELNRTRRGRQRGGARLANPPTFSVMMIDLDHFKNINDSHGHLVGDQVLKTLGDILRDHRVLRQEDIAGRFGGEEFVIVLPDTNGTNAMLPARRLAERLRTAMFQGSNGAAFVVTLSVGIAEFSDEDADEDAVVQRADQALYHAKRTGRDRIVRYEEIPAPDLDAAAQAAQH